MNVPSSCLGRRDTFSSMEVCCGCSWVHSGLEPKGASAHKNARSACVVSAVRA